MYLLVRVLSAHTAPADTVGGFAYVPLELVFVHARARVLCISHPPF